MKTKTFKGGPFDGWPVAPDDEDYPIHTFDFHGRFAVYDDRFQFAGFRQPEPTGAWAPHSDPDWHGKIPRWLRRAVAAGIKRGDFARPVMGARLSGQEAITVLVNDDRFSRIVDHWGADGDRLVMEPYGSEKDLGISCDSEHLAKLLRCEFSISAERATWYPGRTVRVEFWPAKVKQHEVED